MSANGQIVIVRRIKTTPSSSTTLRVEQAAQRCRHPEPSIVQQDADR